MRRRKGRASLTISISSREAAYQQLLRTLELVSELRSETGPALLRRQILAHRIERMLRGESFDRVFGINRKALQGQRNPKRDYWLALEYWLLHRQRVPDDAAVDAVSRAWSEGKPTVRRLRTLGRAVCNDHIDDLLRNVPPEDHRPWIERRLQVVAEERAAILNARTRKASAIPNSLGSADRTRTPTGYCGSTSRKEWTYRASLRTGSTRSHDG